VFSQKMLCRPFHLPQIQILWDMPGGGSVERRPKRAVEDPVDIELAPGILSRVETLSSLFNLLDQDVRRKKTVEGPLEGANLQLTFGPEMGHLVQGVNPGVGPPRGRHRGPLSCEDGKLLLQDPLDRGTPGLNLPSQIIRPIIFDDQLQRAQSSLGHGAVESLRHRVIRYWVIRVFCYWVTGS
jgi:hypothetical protein